MSTANRRNTITSDLVDIDLFVVAEFVKVVLASTAPMESSEELGDNSAETPKVAGNSIILSWTKQELRRSIRPIIIVSTSIASGGHIFH